MIWSDALREIFVTITVTTRTIVIKKKYYNKNNNFKLPGLSIPDI